MPELQLPNYYRGEGKGKYDQNSYYATSNLDVHSQLGTATAQVALASESTTPNEACISEILPNGDVFFASTASGKIWKRTSAGAYSLVHTNTNSPNCGIRFFNGYLYYMSAGKLGRQSLALASSESSWSSQNDSFATFTQGSTHKPTAICNLNLFIGDGKYVARVDSDGTFQANVLDVESQYSVTAIVNSSGWLMVGLTTSTGVCISKIVLWDTYSSSWTYEDDLYEIGINSFMISDNVIFIQAGTVGNIYTWSGSFAEKFKQITGVTTGINPYATDTLNGKALIVIDKQVYSIHRADKDMPYAIVEEFTLPSGTGASLIAKGTSILVPNGSAVYKSGTDKATATVTGPLVEGTFNEVKLPYETLNGCTLGLETSVNGAGFVSEAKFQNDPTNMEYQLVDGPTFDGEIRFFQLRFTLNPSGASSPVVKQAKIFT